MDPSDMPLLEDFQRDLPLVSRPFRQMAEALCTTEDDVLARLVRLRSEGKVARVGATVRPNTAGASTLAALAVPPARLIEVAEIVCAEPGVNHNYQRENRWNLWFVATAATRAELDALLARIEERTRLRVLNLPLVRAFNIDLGFSLHGQRQALGVGQAPDLTELRETDRPLLDALSQGLDLVPTPFAALADSLGWSETEVIARTAALLAAGILTRVGVIVRHRPLGWSSNAMVAFEVPEARIEAAGYALASLPGVTLCYQRRTVPGVWPYGLFCMIHARSRPEAMEILETARDLPDLRQVRYRLLFSERCFKQTGARLVREGGAE